MSSITTPHVVVIPYPAQGHVIPLLEFSQCLARHGIRVTFVNSDYNHGRVLKSLKGNKNHIKEKIHLVSIPDGLEPWEDRIVYENLCYRIAEVMPGKLEELIEDINGREADQKISCLIADGSVANWAFKVAEKMKIRSVAFWPASAAIVSMVFNAPNQLTDDGTSDIYHGTPIEQQTIRLPACKPAVNVADMFLPGVDELVVQKFLDHTANNMKAMKLADWLFCNSSYDLEPAAFSLVPQLLPIGPLLASNRLGDSAGYFWPEDSHCLNWLDQQKPNSVVFVAFGSHTVLDRIQFQELALGLELCNRPFLWVVRPDLINDANDAYPEGFRDRVATRGRMVGWAPQQKVLGHPSIACFLSHCGWNSTSEGVSNGVPFLCWPYFFDQFLDESYICDIWKIGLKFKKNGSRVITREEIKSKVDQVLGDEIFKARVLELKEKVLESVREGGSSNKNIQNFIEWIKAVALPQDTKATSH